MKQTQIGGGASFQSPSLQSCVAVSLFPLNCCPKNQRSNTLKYRKRVPSVTCLLTRWTDRLRTSDTLAQLRTLREWYCPRRILGCDTWIINRRRDASRMSGCVELRLSGRLTSPESRGEERSQPMSGGGTHHRVLPSWFSVCRCYALWDLPGAARTVYVSMM